MFNYDWLITGKAFNGHGQNGNFCPLTALITGHNWLFLDILFILLQWFEFQSLDNLFDWLNRSKFDWIHLKLISEFKIEEKYTNN